MEPKQGELFKYLQRNNFWMQVQVSDKIISGIVKETGRESNLKQTNISGSVL